MYGDHQPSCAAPIRYRVYIRSLAFTVLININKYANVTTNRLIVSRSRVAMVSRRGAKRSRRIAHIRPIIEALLHLYAGD